MSDVSFGGFELSTLKGQIYIMNSDGSLRPPPPKKKLLFFNCCDTKCKF